MKNTNDTAWIKRDGQSQQQRFPEWLNPAKVPLDDRSSKELFRYIFNIAKEVKYFDHTEGDENKTNGTWQDILDYNSSSVDQLWDKLEELKKKQSIPAHFSLLLSFLDLYKQPQRLMNNVTGRHLDFYYHEVLGLKKKEAVPDKAHVIFELKKNTEPYLLKEGIIKLLAGKDILKKDLVYKLTHDIIVNNSKVVQLRSLFINPQNRNLLHFAAAANSADGLGAELDKNNPKWNAFGHEGLPKAQVGFCLASNVLLMQEGQRNVTVKLNLSGFSYRNRLSIIDHIIQFSKLTSLKGNSISRLFSVSLTGAKGWTDIKSVSPDVEKINDTTADLTFKISFTVDDPAIVAYDSALHGPGYATNKPILKILINSSPSHGYRDFIDTNLVSSHISVEVKGMNTSLQLENDFGTLNPKKPFHPFGPTPENDANFWVGSPEVFNKQLSKLQLNIEWKNIPDKKLEDYYKGYTTLVNNSNITANATFSDGAGWNVVNDKNTLFDNLSDATKKDENNVSKKIVFTKFGRPEIKLPPFKIDILPEKIVRSSGTTLAQEVAKKVSLSNSWQSFGIDLPFGLGTIGTGSFGFGSSPFAFFLSPQIALQASWIFKIIPSHTANVSMRKGFIHLALNQGFLFREYREIFTKQVIAAAKSGNTDSLIKEPFAPEIQTLTLDYIATTGTVSFTEETLNDYIGTEIELFHVGPFGQMREHAYARMQTGFLTNNAVKLLPQYNSEGNFYVGLSGLQANDSVCLLFQVAEGSADPELAKTDLQWSVLCDNYWKKLNTQDFIFDTTNDLLTSGVVKLIIPREATNINSIMPDGLLWLKISIAKDSRAVCQLVDVLSNAAIVEFENNENDPGHLKQPLVNGVISKLQQPVGAIKTISQPYSSFGGQMQENDKGFYTRVSERLRHKERSVACWDYERLILQHFPNLYKVKCINHASSSSFTDAGHTLLVVIPDLSNQNAIDPFQPKADKNTLDEIEKFLKKHSTAWAEHHVINPLYEPVKISVTVKLKKGYEFNYYQHEINKRLQYFLSPWIKGQQKEIHFGGRVTESQIVKLLEDLEYVDYITGLQLSRSTNEGKTFSAVKQFIEATSPASILVSYTQHEIKQAEENE